MKDEEEELWREIKQKQKIQKSGDRHQPTSQQSSHRNHGHNNDRHGSDRRSGGDNHRSNNNYSGNNNRNSGNGRDQRNQGQQSNRSANSGSQQSMGPSEGYSYPVCTTCGRRHPRECRRVAGTCFKCGQAGHLHKDCKKNTTASTSGQADKKPGASGRVFAITEDHATKTSVGHFKVSILSKVIGNNVLGAHSMGGHHKWDSWIPKKVNVMVWKDSLDRIAMCLNLMARGVWNLEKGVELVESSSPISFLSFSIVEVANGRVNIQGPDHAPRFKATVNFNGESYESPNYCTTLRQAEHSAAEVALLKLQGSSNSLAARILDETGVYKNLLQEVSQRVGASLPTYTTFRSGLGHLPVFTCTVELAGCIFTGEPAKNKKQAEKNAAMSAWSSLKLLTQQTESLSLQKGNTEEQEHVIVARALQKFRLKARMSNVPFPIRFPVPKPKTLAGQPPQSTSKILPLICPKNGPSRHPQSAAQTCLNTPQTHRTTTNEPSSATTSAQSAVHKFPAIGAAPYIPVRHFRAHHGIAPPVTMRNSIPVFSAPPLPSPRMGVAPPNHLPPQFGRLQPMCGNVAPPVTIRQAVPVFSAPAAPTKPATNSIMPPIEAIPEDSKSPVKLPLPTEDKVSNVPQVPPKMEDEEAIELGEPGLKELQI
uniref:Double-stranded RNA-binding protein 2-like n=1 Tax=Tanacetum cinerariifolium TaxID=118510 RepID=A0A6L2NP82_TANCI|nr:double-stranded RNA-binding protein 2-like [Tanacetum cinerariifolium]